MKKKKRLSLRLDTIPMPSADEVIDAMLKKHQESTQSQYRGNRELPPLLIQDFSVLHMVPPVKTIEFKDIAGTDCYLRKHVHHNWVSIGKTGAVGSSIPLDKEAVEKLIPHLQNFLETGEI